MSTHGPTASMFLAFRDMGHSKKTQNVGFSRRHRVLRTEKIGPGRINAHALHAVWKLC